jgi:hypothetical protein
VKEKIAVEHSMQADMMKIIAYGKVMDDDSKNLKDCAIKEGDFLVVMVSKVLSISPNLIPSRPNPLQNPRLKTKRKKMKHLPSNNRRPQLKPHHHKWLAVEGLNNNPLITRAKQMPKPTYPLRQKKQSMT